MGRLARSVRRGRRVALTLALGALLAWFTTASIDCDACESDPPVLRNDGACSQPGFDTHGARQEHTFTWVVNADTIPAYLDREGAVRAIRQGTDMMQRARTPCPEARDLKPALPAAIFAGSTQRHANIASDARCFPPSRTDGINVVSFGRLPEDVLAVTCTYIAGEDIWQSDIALNDGPALFTLSPRDEACEFRFDLQAVVTHERGHSFGLAHVAEDTDGDDLTMSSVLGRCDTSARTLGWGDVLGLTYLYPGNGDE